MQKTDSRFGRQLATIMSQQNVTAYRISKDLGVSQSSIKNWIDGKTSPSVETVVHLADYFDLSLDAMMGRENKNRSGLARNSKSSQRLFVDPQGNIISGASFSSEQERLYSLRADPLLRQYVEEVVLEILEKRSQG